MPKIYTYQAVTRIFLSEQEAMESPAEPGVFLLPAFATFTAPPLIPTGKSAIWESNHWVLVNMPPVEAESVLVGWLATDAEKQVILNKFATDHMDNAARAVGFEGIADAVASAPANPTNQAGRDAAALKDWRLAMLSKVHDWLTAVQGNHNPMPAIADITGSFPKWVRVVPDPTVGSMPGTVHQPAEPPPPPYVPPPPPPVFPDVSYPVTPPNATQTS